MIAGRIIAATIVAAVPAALAVNPAAELIYQLMRPSNTRDGDPAAGHARRRADTLGFATGLVVYIATWALLTDPC